MYAFLPRVLLVSHFCHANTACFDHFEQKWQEEPDKCVRLASRVLNILAWSAWTTSVCGILCLKMMRMWLDGKQAVQWRTTRHVLTRKWQTKLIMRTLIIRKISRGRPVEWKFKRQVSPQNRTLKRYAF